MRLLQRSAEGHDALRRQLRAVDRRRRGGAAAAAGRLVLLRQRHPGRQGRDDDQVAPGRPRLVGPPRLGRRRRRPAPSSARSPSRSCTASNGKRCPVARRVRRRRTEGVRHRDQQARGRRRRRRRPRAGRHDRRRRDAARSSSGRGRRSRADSSHAGSSAAPRAAASTRGSRADGRRSRCSTPRGTVVRARSARAPAWSRRPQDTEVKAAPVWVVTGYRRGGRRARPPRRSTRARWTASFAVAISGGRPTALPAAR